jgi:hypothetical protein
MRNWYRRGRNLAESAGRHDSSCSKGRKGAPRLNCRPPITSTSSFTSEMRGP